jgi:osmoprotectant transport system ATP-binding protein
MLWEEFFMIRFENITKKYDQKVVVSDINIEIEKGDFVVLIGSSGCGKTTLLKIINRLISPTAGNVFINNESIYDKNIIELRRNIGYVIQQTGLFPHMTVRQNIDIIPRLQRKNKDDIAKRVIELMAMVSLNPAHYLDRYPSQLSGGQQQRIGVARAFACDPDIILMDEPFSALDPITRSQLQDELVKLHLSLRKTIVFVTHDMNEAIKIADKICIIHAGGIAQYGTVEEIMKNPANDFVADFIGKNRIWSSPELIRARDIMIRDPICVPEWTTILRCLIEMRSMHVDSLMVTNGFGLLLGIVTAKQAQSCNNKNTPVNSIMQKEFDKVSPDQNIIEILHTFNKSTISYIPVTDAEGMLEGLITKSSLLTTLSSQYLNNSEEL